MQNLQAQANALFQAVEEFKSCKRNPSGTLSGNAVNAINKRLRKKLEAAGAEPDDAWAMVLDLRKNQK